jgi:glutathione S-transferase
MKVYHTPRTRSLRVLWMLEEMGLAYEVESMEFPPALTTPAYRKVNPIATVPALEDGDILIFESTAILEYLAARHGPTELVPAPDAANWPVYMDYLHYGEATMAAPLTSLVRTKFQAPEDEKDNWTARIIAKTFLYKLKLVEDRLAQGEFIAGDAFTAADISVGYGLFLGRLLGLHETYPHAVADYFNRLKAREAYQRAVAV